MNSQEVQPKVTVDRAWRLSAACSRQGAPDMFPDDKNEAGIELAKRTCFSCPVLQTCREDALQRREVFGVWGGLFGDQLKSRHRRAARKAAAEGR